MWYSPNLSQVITILFWCSSGMRDLLPVFSLIRFHCLHLKPSAFSRVMTICQTLSTAALRDIGTLSTLEWTSSAYRHRHAIKMIPDVMSPTVSSSDNRPKSQKYWRSVGSSGMVSPMAAMTRARGSQNSLRMSAHCTRCSILSLCVVHFLHLSSSSSAPWR